MLSGRYTVASSWGSSDCMWSHISQGLSDTQLEHPSEKTINCCSVVKHLFCYWRHWNICVRWVWERSQFLLQTSSWWSCALCMFRQFVCLLWIAGPHLTLVLAEQSHGYYLSGLNADLQDLSDSGAIFTTCKKELENGTNWVRPTPICPGTLSPEVETGDGISGDHTSLASFCSPFPSTSIACRTVLWGMLEYSPA